MLVTEGKRDRQLEIYLPLFTERGIEMTLSQLKQMLLAKFVNEAGIHNLSLESNYYLAGVAKYYFNGDLTSNKRLNALYPNVKDKFNNEVCSRLNELILILRNAYIDSVGTQFEQPEDFGALTIQKLLRKYNKKINAALGIDTPKKETQKKPQVSDDYTAGGDYTYEILYSYDDARKYYEATSPGAWCITYGEQHYNRYLRQHNAHYIIFRKNGFESIPRQKGPNWTSRKPQDEFGNSLIAVIQSNADPYRLPIITSRWNHGVYSEGTSCEADHAYTTEEFLNVIGCDRSILKRAYDQWKEESNYHRATNGESQDTKEKRLNKMAALRKFKYTQMLLNNGANPKSLHDNPDIKLDLRIISALSTSDDALKDTKYNGTYFVSIESNGENYYSLWDRRKILFDKFLYRQDDFYRGNYLVGDGIVELRPKGYHEDRYLYDQKYHRFIEVDGKVKFKDISSGNGHICVAISGRQYALINMATRKPVLAKDRTPWFESIGGRNYGRSVSTPYIGGSHQKYIPLIFDSSADEKYVYNLQKCRFIDLGDTNDWEYSSYWSTDNFVAAQNKKNYFYKFVNVNDNSVLNIMGHEEFSSLRADEENDIFAFKLNNDNKGWLVYDRKMDDLVKINGEPITLNERYEPIDNIHYNDINTFSVLLIEKKSMYLFNPLTRKLMHDKISGYVFGRNSYCGRNSYRGRVMVEAPSDYSGPIDERAGELYRHNGVIPETMSVFKYYYNYQALNVYFTKSPEEDAAEQGLQVESVKRNFWSTLGKLNRRL